MKAQDKKPSVLVKKDFSNIIELCKDYIDGLENPNPDTAEFKALKNSIFESAIESVYGVGVWNYINSDKIVQLNYKKNTLI